MQTLSKSPIFFFHIFSTEYNESFVFCISEDDLHDKCWGSIKKLIQCVSLNDVQRWDTLFGQWIKIKSLPDSYFCRDLWGKLEALQPKKCHTELKSQTGTIYIDLDTKKCVNEKKKIFGFNNFAEHFLLVWLQKAVVVSGTDGLSHFHVYWAHSIANAANPLSIHTFVWQNSLAGSMLPYGCFAVWGFSTCARTSGVTSFSRRVRKKKKNPTGEAKREDALWTSHWFIKWNHPKPKPTLCVNTLPPKQIPHWRHGRSRGIFVRRGKRCRSKWIEATNSQLSNLCRRAVTSSPTAFQPLVFGLFKQITLQSIEPFFF